MPFVPDQQQPRRSRFVPDVRPVSSPIPPLPPGFTLDGPRAMNWRDDPIVSEPASVRPAWMADPVVSEQQAIPPLPPGFTLDEPQHEQSAAERLRLENPAEYDPNSPEFQARYGATSGMSAGQRFMAGAGKSVVDLGRGLRQIGTEIGERTGILGPDVEQLVTWQSRSDRLRAGQDEVNRLDAPLMGTVGGAAGNILGTLATTLIPGTLVARSAQAANLARTAGAARAFVNPATYRAAAGAGAIQGAIQPVGTDESRTANVGTGAALGPVGHFVGNRIAQFAQPLKRTLNKENAAAVKALIEAGVPIDTAQRSGSKAAEVVKRAVSDNPFTSPGQAAFIDKQQRAFTRAVLKTIGADAEVATADIMDHAATRIGQVFDDVAARNPVRFDSNLNNDLMQVWRDSARELPTPEAAVIQRQIEEIAGKVNNGLIDGAAYQNLRTSLGRVSQQRSPLGHWAGELRATIDDALQRSARPEDMKALRQARLEYRRMLQIEGAIDNEGGGLISASRLANILGRKANVRQSKYGRGDQQLVMLAQAGKKVLPDKFPNSGTPARLAGQLVAPAAIGLGTGYATGDPTAGIATALGTAATLRGARGALNNQAIARYLSEGLPAGRTRNTFEQLGGAGLLRHAPVVVGFGMDATMQPDQ